MYRHRSTWMCWCTVMALATAAWAQIATQPAASTQPSVAEGSGGAAKTGQVKGNDVYIRSGFSTNYYPVTKLNRGDEVRIVDQKFGWLEIEPPVGTYSLIDKTYVDAADGKTGVVNGTTWTYAGSNLNEQRYAKQVKLEKGDRVQILGPTADGALYKIEPPAGATLWIKADLVDRSGTALVDSTGRSDLEPVKPGTLNLAEGGSKQATPVPAPGVRPRETRRPAPPPKEPKDTDRYQLQINAIEAEIAAESAKPLGERTLRPILAKLEPIAAQADDEVAQVYAQTRIDQLKGHLELVEAVAQIRDLTDTAIEAANQEARRRDRIRPEPPGPLDDVVLRGEIRVSGIYNGEANRPKRWRVVDPSSEKTQAYIELPDGSPIDPVQYYGKYVGIRASGSRQLKGTIPPVPVFTVQEILVLDPASRQGDRTSGETYSASPTPPAVAAPSSQPAESTPQSE